MTKEIPVDALKAAVAKLNSILEEGKIKTVGKKKVDIITAFAEKVSEITEAGKAKDLPGECIEFFNTYIVNDDESEGAADTKKDAAPAASVKKGTAKKGATPASTKKSADKETPDARKAESRSESSTRKGRSTSSEVTNRNKMIYDLIAAGKNTKVEIVKLVSEKFTSVKPITIGTFIQDCMNVKYNKLDKLTVRNDKGLLSFSK